MYYKISNSFDYLMLYSMFRNIIPESVLGAINDKVKIFEESYNGTKEFRDYGCSVLFFPMQEDYDKVYCKFLQYYKIKDELAEYCDELVKENSVVWKEKLFLIGAETGYVLVYPEEK